MHTVEQDGVSTDFIGAWQAALKHLSVMGGDSIRWLRAYLDQPFAEHLSFVLGNQLFFVYVQAAEFQDLPTEEVFLWCSKQANAIPCRLPMVVAAGEWTRRNQGWGLNHAVTGKPVDPAALVSEELILMTDWEVHDVGIQVVAQHLSRENCSVISRQPDPRIFPQLWFDDNGHSFWALVNATRDPAALPRLNEGIRAQAQTMAQELGSRGFFGSVLVTSCDAVVDDEGNWENLTPLFRGHPLQVSFDGLQPAFSVS